MRLLFYFIHYFLKAEEKPSDKIQQQKKTEGDRDYYDIRGENHRRQILFLKSAVFFDLVAKLFFRVLIGLFQNIFIF